MKNNKRLLILLIFMVIILFSSCNKTVTNTEVNNNVNVYDYLGDSQFLATPSLFEDGFRFEIQYADSKVEQDGLGRMATIQNSADGQERMARAEEWGYSITKLDGIVDGMGREVKSTIKGENVPTDRQEAVEKIKQFLDAQYKSKSLTGTFYSMNGHFPWHHYAGEAGFDVLGSEIGENINNYQWHIALNRGAARQYQTPWFIDFSMWYGPSILDYSSTPNWPEYSNPTGGHSLSLFERSMIMSYMAGADSLVAEAGDQICYLDDGSVSPYGEVCKKITTFANQNSDIGISYTPFAVVLDYYHGTYSGVTEKLAFDTFKYNDGDKMTDDLLNMLWPDGIKRTISTEKGLMINNGYGDIFDVLLQNAEFNTLKNYPCLILSGDIKLSNDEVQKYLDYVTNGGTIVLNTAYLKYFTQWAEPDEDVVELTYGNGRVIIYGDDFDVDELEEIIPKLTKQYVPFTFSEDIEYLVNVKENSILLTVINNNGINKAPKKKEKISKYKQVSLNVQFTGTQSIDTVNKLYGNSNLSVNGNITELNIAPGETVIIEYVFK